MRRILTGTWHLIDLGDHLTLRVDEMHKRFVVGVDFFTRLPCTISALLVQEWFANIHPASEYSIPMNNFAAVPVLLIVHSLGF